MAFSTCTVSSSAWTMKVGGCLVGGVDVGVGCEVFVGEREVAGIDDQREVGAAAELVGGIDGVVEALVVVGAEGC